MNNKETKIWKVAFMHWFVFAFIFQFFFNNFFVSLLWYSLKLDPNFSATISLIVTPFIYSVGAILSSFFVNTVFNIIDKIEIAKLSTLLIIIISGGIRYFSFMYSPIDVNDSSILYLNIIDNIFFVIGVIAFYYLSKKYIAKTIQN